MFFIILIAPIALVIVLSPLLLLAAWLLSRKLTKGMTREEKKAFARGFQQGSGSSGTGLGKSYLRLQAFNFATSPSKWLPHEQEQALKGNNR